MRARQRRTLERLFSKPTPANIRRADVVSLMDALNFEITERSGSRVAFDAGECWYSTSLIRALRCAGGIATSWIFWKGRG